MGHHCILGIKVLFFFLSVLACQETSAHDGWGKHVDDMLNAFGFQENGKLTGWMRFISSDMIDKRDNFYNSLKIKHPGFKCNHRLLYHWGYNAEPWNKALEERVKKYCEDYDLNVESNIRIFKSELKSEQRRRNRLINKKTEDLFGFAHGGRDASYANFFCSMAYNIHLLGDYMSDNSDLEGLMDMKELIGSFVTDIRSFDNKSCKSIIKGITQINLKYSNPQQKADSLMAYLKTNLPTFIKQANDGSVKRRLEARGFKFK